VSKASKRRQARGERWLTMDRTAARRRAFTVGLQRCLHEPGFRAALLDDTASNWEGMAILTNEEKAKVRKDVLQFAGLNDEERVALFQPAKKPKKSLREKVKAAFERVLGA